MIGDLVPPGVEAREAYGDDGPEASIALFAAEEALVEGVVAERRREFTTVRGCARRALRRLGAPVGPLLPDASGAPRWPEGVVGSMTHCRGYRAAAVARASDVTALGIDAEPAAPLPAAVAARIVPSAAAQWLEDDVWTASDVPRDRLLFCAKEASYKAFSPRLGSRFGFNDFRVRLAPDGTFRGDPPDGSGGFRGRWTARSGYLLAAVCLV
ncbi:4'-phosphopantetheinyl transferase superfamily protein [Streptomyces sp. NPDC006610]|jgi:4'-phosphopantetheinyl transferase EntD|uniref:4'-phosphopantetheinyl transferase family protein n=1 Tax=Streptomyces sp. NPDC006610 TaxID=3154584 RepID=UPI0033B1D9B3